MNEYDKVFLSNVETFISEQINYMCKRLSYLKGEESMKMNFALNRAMDLHMIVEGRLKQDD